MTIQDTSTERADGNHFVLTPLTRAQTTQLVRLCTDAAGDRGLRARYDGAGGLELIPGPSLSGLPGLDPPIVAGLTNLARIVAPHRQHRWPQLVADHFDRLRHQLVDGPPSPPADPERELLLRLTPRAALPADWTADLPDFLPGLVAVPATEDDGVITMHLDAADYGMTRTEAQEVGLANLRRLTDEVEYVEHDGARVAVLSGSTFTASRALVLDTVLAESLQVPDPEYGVLVALPVRGLLLVHVVTDLSVLPALATMLGMSLRTHAEHPGPLTPWVHLVTGTSWQSATTQTPDFRDLRSSAAFHALVQSLPHSRPERPE
ncbi:hypothetical protein FB561_2605 [Kribbella amoyensis]|uniref:Uncharacterized protein n=1 Tax=Kribbella amoyensis TaxID=996641 RepID=A0A561BRQ6_9ACTN|nr:hypothetical protein [Kribbella amoyensis]TWD81489.1 hypothetical protein FB561_2605 [Kribbella amoyensis]